MVATAESEIRNQVVTLVRDFVRREVEPIAQRYDNEDIYPHELIEPMREMGLFGITIPEEYGGMGLDHTTFAVIFEELSRGWMSVSGIIGTHHVLAHIVTNNGTDEQKGRILPRLASGELRGGLALTEPEAGSDVQNISTVATRDGEEYVIRGTRCSSPTRSTATRSRFWRRRTRTRSLDTEDELLLRGKAESGRPSRAAPGQAGIPRAGLVGANLR